MLYKHSIKAKSLSSLHFRRSFSSSVSDSGFFILFSVLIGSRPAAGFLLIYPFAFNQLKKLLKTRRMLSRYAPDTCRFSLYIEMYKNRSLSVISFTGLFKYFSIRRKCKLYNSIVLSDLPSTFFLTKKVPSSSSQLLSIFWSSVLFSDIS